MYQTKLFLTKCPHLGQLEADSEILLLHSGQVIKAIQYLPIGQKLIFKPAQDLGTHNKSDFIAIIENDRTNCVKREKDRQCYSLSGLRRIIANELDLTEVKTNWGFGVRYDWITEDGKSLEDLNSEN